MKNQADPKEKIRGLVQDFSTAMLVTHSEGEGLRARPMAIADVTPTCGLWFLSSENSAKVHEIQKDTHVQVLCQKEPTVYLTFSGTASIVYDRALVAALWKEAYRVWFPKGQDDPDLVLIAFEPQRAEFWDNEGMHRIGYLWEAARAYLTGTTPKIVEGEQHGVVSL